MRGCRSGVVCGDGVIGTAYIAVCDDEIVAVFEDAADADLFWLRNNGVTDCWIYEADFYPSQAMERAERPNTN